MGGATAPLRPPQQGTSVDAASPQKNLSETQSMPVLGADASQPTLPKLDLSRGGGPKKGPAPPGAQSGRSPGLQEAENESCGRSAPNRPDNWPLHTGCTFPM